MSDTRYQQMSRQRNRFVYRWVVSLTEREQKEVAALAQGLPVTLRSQGLAVTIARLFSSDNNSSQLLSRLFLEWLTQSAGEFLPSLSGSRKNQAEFLEAVLEMDRPDYLAFQREAMAFSEQVKLITKAVYAGAELTGKGDD